MEFNVFREQIRSRSDLERFIYTYWNARNIKFRGGHGLLLNSAATIADGFEMTHSAYCKNTDLLVHCFSITFDKGISDSYIFDTVEKIKNYLSNKYQLIYMIAQDDYEMMEVGFIINSVSYITGKNFYDNNKSYIELVHILGEIDGRLCNIKFGGNVFFKAVGSNMVCYAK